MKKRILTGDRTTGQLHLGHYIGSLQNRVKLQEEYETFVLLADIQAMTTHFNSPKLIHQSIYDVALDNLSVGLDPEKVTLIQQSQVKAIAELTIYYSMITTVNSLRHNPTIKTEIKQYGYNDLNYGFLGYPVSQAADMTFCQADLVPVGDDQLPHMELARKIIKKFNGLYSPGRDLIKTPQAMLSECPRLIGIDGNSKMGKSANNAIFLTDKADLVHRKIMSALTDRTRISLSDPGHPEDCVVAVYHQAFNTLEYQDIQHRCRKAALGCVACKQRLATVINKQLDPIRERRAYYEGRIDQIREHIMLGSSKASAIGDETVERIKDAMHLKL